MKKVQSKLMKMFWAPLIVCAVLVLLFESNILPTGLWATCKQSEFVLLSFMELATIILIPFALRLFKFKRISRQLTAEESQKPAMLLRLGGLRLALLSLPMFLNTLLYYLYMHVGFLYLAIILALCMAFVYPSLQRCIDETASTDEE